MPERSRNALLIAAIDALASGRLPRLFSDAGFRVHLLASRHLAVSKSAFLASRIECAPGPAAAALAARDHLKSHRPEYDSIVLADEPCLWAALDQGSDAWLEGWFPVPLKPDALDRLRSKVRFLADSRAAGIPTPRFEICATETELRAAAASMGMPVFIKATRGLAGSGLFFARTQAEFDAQVATMSFDWPVVAQDEIVGESGSASVLYHRGRPVCWFAYIMKRLWPNRFSSACTIELFSSPQAESLVRQVGELTEFTGLAGIDFMVDSTRSKLLLLEFNPRPTPAYHLGPQAGVDFSLALRNGGSGAAEQRPNGSTAVIDLFPQSLYYSLEHARPMQFIRCLRDAQWSEPALTIAHFRRFVTHYIPAPVKRLLKRETAVAAAVRPSNQ
jgi:carbamoylphosphate synthase large subunit